MDFDAILKELLTEEDRPQVDCDADAIAVAIEDGLSADEAIKEACVDLSETEKQGVLDRFAELYLTDPHQFKLNEIEDE